MLLLFFSLTLMDETLPGLTTDENQGSEELAPLTVIRTETALSRFPVHRIAKKGTVRIELKHQASAFLWRVSYSRDHGQPGPLAYKLDTLVVNRRIEEASRPLPRYIRLGSLRDIALEIGAGEKNTQAVKQALLQNAFANITAKISYRATDRSDRTLEAAFTRYSIVFTGETLPDGKNADAVYLVLNEIYMEVLNAAITRPLDYDYMKSLPPAAQRFYEIVSYQIYAALLHDNERAKLRYSEYCMLSTATRYFDFNHVKKQMYKIHLPHLDIGYLARVSYEETTDDAGKPDWFMWYTPGINAARQYTEFTQSGRRNKRGKRSAELQTALATLALPFADAQQVTLPKPEAIDPAPPEDKTLALVSELVAAGLNRTTALSFAQEQAEECLRQLRYLPYVTDFKISQGAYLRRAIEQGFAPPVGYQKKQAEEAERERKREETAARNTRKAAQDARRAAEDAQIDIAMTQLETGAPEAFSGFLRYIASERELTETKHSAMPASIRRRMLAEFDNKVKRRALFQAWRTLSEGQYTSRDAAAAHAPEETPESIRAILNAQFARAEERNDS